jgi:hypothetical protein
MLTSDTGYVHAHFGYQQYLVRVRARTLWVPAILSKTSNLTCYVHAHFGYQQYLVRVRARTLWVPAVLSKTSNLTCYVLEN